MKFSWSHVLLVLAVLCNFAPEHMATWFGGRVSAWDYVVQGVQVASLWVAVAAKWRTPMVIAVCAYGFFEAIQRPVCRLAFPMDSAPKLEQGQNLCDAAFGFPASTLSIVAVLIVVVLTWTKHLARS